MTLFSASSGKQQQPIGIKTSFTLADSGETYDVNFRSYPNISSEKMEEKLKISESDVFSANTVKQHQTKQLHDFP